MQNTQVDAARLFGVGYFGTKRKRSEKVSETAAYKVWNKMLSRCYWPKYSERFPTYSNCAVVNEWHDFDEFLRWYNENYYYIDGQRMNLDKDILVNKNKMYTPDKCIFVPERINMLFTKCDANRGKYPIGVTYRKDRGTYTAQSWGANGKHYYIGSSKTPYGAFLKYKEFKENVIREVAVQYRQKIPQKLYEALWQYKVDIND